MKLRPFTQQALKSPYFIRKPLPCPSHLLPKPLSKQDKEKEVSVDTKNLPIGDQTWIVP